MQYEFAMQSAPESGSLKGELQTPMVSVIVPCYNSQRTIRACLRSLLAQSTTAPFEVTVVDSSTDTTAAIVSHEFPSVTLIRLQSRTFAGAARNIGAHVARGQYCLMIDSDCVAAPDLIDRMVARHADRDYAAVGGAIANGTPRSLSGLLCYLLEFKEFIPRAPRRLVTSVPTANVCYRREALERQGGFDDEMWLAEDILLNWKIHRSGGLILFDPEIKVTHFNRTGWINVFSYQWPMGRYSAIARRRGGLPGDVALRFPVLIALMPFARLLRAALWLMKYDRSTFARFLLISPMYLLSCTIWAAGFFQEAAGGISEA